MPNVDHGPLEEAIVTPQESGNRAPFEAEQQPEATNEANREAEPELDRSVRFEDLPKEEQERLLPEALAHMRKVLEGTKDYAVFASTAMYLNGEMLEEQGDKAGAELKTPPGDFDAAVFSEQSLKEIQARMVEHPKDEGVFQFYKVENGEVVYDENHDPVLQETPSDFVSIRGEDVKKLAGKFVFEAEITSEDAQGNAVKEKKPVKYDFEFFYKSHIVPPELAEGRTIEAQGLQILNLEGLEAQYTKNLNFEGGIEEQVSQTMDQLEDLKASDFRAELLDWDGESPLSAETEHVVENLGLGAVETKRVFEIQNRIDDLNTQQAKAKRKIPDLQKLQMTYRELGLADKVVEVRAMASALDAESKMHEDEKRRLISERATLLTGTKTKLWKRELNVLQLARIRSGERPMEFKKMMPANVSLGEEQPDYRAANTGMEAAALEEAA